jgi:hypothetical protein
MTATDFALIVLGRTVNALLTTGIVIPLFALLAVAGWWLFDSAGVGASVCAFALAALWLRPSVH